MNIQNASGADLKVFLNYEGLNRLRCRSCTSCSSTRSCNSCGCSCPATCLKCFIITLEETLELLDRVNFRLSKLSKEIKSWIVYKYDRKKEYIIFQKLVLYKDSIERYRDKLLLGVNPCIKPEYIQLLFEKARRLLGIGYSLETMFSDYPRALKIEDNLDSFLIKNPQCIPVEEWERLAYKVCDNLELVINSDFEVEIKETKCNITYDLITEALPLKILSGLSQAKLAQRKDTTEVECKLEYDILINNHTCDLSFDSYAYLVNDCNLSYDLIKEAYSCNLSFQVENNTAYLSTGNTKYDINKIDFKSEINPNKHIGQ